MGALLILMQLAKTLPERDHPELCELSDKSLFLS